jgi:hypothetical protein
MSWVVLQHQHPTHEDYTIVSIHPLPAHAMHFDAVHEVVLEFLEEHMHVRVRNIQPSHLGQALVRFENAHDRDSLVINGPRPYGDVQFSFIRHNQGRNWRLMNFNRECWLMLLGFPLDYWNHESIQSAIGVFGRVMLWENDRNHLARLLVRARITDLQDVPHFLVLTDMEGFNGESWTIQCEILEQEMLKQLPADEDHVPVIAENGQPPMSDFFGLGQPAHQHHNFQLALKNAKQDHQAGWGQWA